MVEALGLPTISFTHSAADLHWSELAQLICPDSPDSRAARAKAIIKNAALANCCFYHRVMEFIKALSLELLTTGHSSSGSTMGPHVHGLAWLPGTPDVEQLLVDNK